MPTRTCGRPTQAGTACAVDVGATGRCGVHGQVKPPLRAAAPSAPARFGAPQATFSPFDDDEPTDPDAPYGRTPSGRPAQPEPADLVSTNPHDNPRQTIGQYTFSSHMEARRSEMGVSRLRILQAVSRPGETYVQDYDGRKRVAVVSPPYTIYMSEDRAELITMVWRTSNRRYHRSEGVPADCSEGHLLTRCGFPGAPSTDKSVRLAEQRHRAGGAGPRA